MKRLLVGLLSLLLVLIFWMTNPSRDDFRDFIEDRVESEARKKTGWKSLAMDLLARPASWLANELTTRKEFYLFSIYRIELNDRKEEDIVFIGALNTFINVKGGKKWRDMVEAERENN